MTDISVVVTDLDGTFWETEDHVPDATLAAVAELEGRGIPLLIATGRRLQSTRGPMTELGLAPPAVMLNGGLGMYLDSGHRFFVDAFAPDTAAAILGAFRAHDVEPCVYIDGESPAVFVSPNPSTHEGHLASFRDQVATADLGRIVEEEDVLAFGVLGVDADRATPVHEALGALAVPHLAPDRKYGGFGITAAPIGRSKWDGIAAWCADAGVDPTGVMAVGDGPNDVEMLQGAAVAVVMADGHELALAEADHVIPTALDGGWGGIPALIDSLT